MGYDRACPQCRKRFIGVARFCPRCGMNVAPPPLPLPARRKGHPILLAIAIAAPVFLGMVFFSVVTHTAIRSGSMSVSPMPVPQGEPVLIYPGANVGPNASASPYSQRYEAQQASHAYQEVQKQMHEQLEEQRKEWANQRGW